MAKAEAAPLGVGGDPPMIEILSSIVATVLLWSDLALRWKRRRKK